MVNFSDHLFKAGIIETILLTHKLKLIWGDIATSISIKVWESSKQVILSLDFVEMQCCSYKLSIIDCSTVINISLQYEKVGQITYGMEPKIRIMTVRSMNLWHTQNKKFQTMILNLNLLDERHNRPLTTVNGAGGWGFKSILAQPSGYENSFAWL